MFRKLIRFIFVVSLLVANIVFADYLVIQRNANIRERPNTSSNVIRKAYSGETFILLDENKQQNGYYHVTERNGHITGWIYRTLGKKVFEELTEVSTDTSANINTNYTAVNKHLCHKHLPYGIPLQSDRVICRDGYAVGYNYKYKTPDWVAYTLTNESVHGANVERLDQYTEDPDIPQQYRSTPKDYDEPVYDVGHMAPAEAIDYSRAANDETFYLSNMAPQYAGFNRGIWKRTENRVRKWVAKTTQYNREKLLHVVAGTYYTGQVDTIGNSVAVPNYFFKIVFDPIKKQAIAFWLPHVPKPPADKYELDHYITTIVYIEGKTGMKFFAWLDKETKDKIKKSSITINEWQRY